MERREFDRLDDLVHVDYEWDQVAENPGTQVVRGRENVRARLEGWTPDTWDEYRTTSEGLLEVDHRVLQFIRIRAYRAGKRGNRLDLPCASVHTIAEGRLRKTEHYFHRGDALKALGLSESDWPADD